MATRRRIQKEQPKLVWRVSAHAPMGEYVDPRIPTEKDNRVEPAEPRENSLLASSLELLGGVRVSDTPMDTLPGDLIDEFFKR
jgi:hypothetical protein